MSVGQLSPGTGGPPATGAPAGGEGIVVRNLTKQYKQLRAVDDLSFSVRPGRVTGFLGPNGAGKTTTLRMLLNLVTPTAGTATIGGQRYADLTEPLRHVGAVLEASSAHKGRTGINHLRVICAAAGLPKERADQALALVGLTPAAKRKFKGFSLGMRQRLGIAAALLREPELLVLDEPTNGLDPRGIGEIRELLTALNEAGTTVVLSSHLLAEVDALCHRVGVMDSGRLVLTEDLATLRAPTGRVLLRTPDPAAAVAELDGRVVHRDGDTLTVRHDDAAALNARLVGVGVRVAGLAAERRTLEQVVLGLTGHGTDRVDAGRRADPPDRDDGGMSGVDLFTPPDGATAVRRAAEREVRP